MPGPRDIAYWGIDLAWVSMGKTVCPVVHTTNSNTYLQREWNTGSTRSKRTFFFFFFEKKELIFFFNFTNLKRSSEILELKTINF